jgi:cation transport regulator ChaC
LSRGEITVDQFDAMHAEKVYQIGGQKAQFVTDQKRLQLQQKAVQNQGAAIRQRANHHQQTMQQRENHHQDSLEQGRIQQNQLENIRQEVSQPKTLTCFGSGNFIHCN